jgi:2-polyprenyl-3-methyl-5-hydroxy-6-metoxy-1,4-benzoquinol methylase
VSARHTTVSKSLSHLQAEQQWQEKEYSRVAVAPTDPRVVARYLTPLRRKPIFRREFLFQCLLPVEGLEILELGCGDGAVSCLLARAGARMTCVDISHRAIALAGERARLDGVEDRCKFLATPVQQMVLEGKQFDVVLGDSVLHHLIPDLPETLAKIRNALRPGGRAIFVEPLNLFPPLRKLRLSLPIKLHGSPGERPLEKAEIDQILRAFTRVEIDYFSLSGRLTGFISGDIYEGAGAVTRSLQYSLNALDWFVLHRLRILQRFASYGVLQCWV